MFESAGQNFWLVGNLSIVYIQAHLAYLISSESQQLLADTIKWLQTAFSICCASSVSGAAARRRSLEDSIGLAHLRFSLVAQGLYAIPSIQRLSDLLVSVYEALQLCVQLNVLTGKHIAVML